MNQKIPRVLAGAVIALAVAGCGLASVPQPASLKLAPPSAIDAATVSRSAGDTQPAPSQADPASAEAPLQLDGNPVTVYVQATATGFEPAVVSIPQGMRVRMVLINRDKSEHHFHVLGLRAGAAMWRVTDHDHDHQNTLSSGAVGDTLEGGEALPISYVDQHPCQHFCVNGICYTKNTLHTYAAPGSSDEVIFTPRDKGEFVAADPLNPELKATVRVF